jgi:tagatose-1,6-bisphosphate aldolase non-catalytic subunit AgaZ/GatZ
MLNEDAAYKMKMNKLMVEFKASRMPDTEFINSFLPRVWKKIQDGKFGLSTREKEVIDDLFDKN